jgi:microcystin-dependent protein
MATPFLGEIRLFSFNFPPRGWAFCNGQLMAINQNQALFSLLGTTYGGDGRVNFALPNLQSRIPLHFGQSFQGSRQLGEFGGQESHTLLASEMPQHSHPLVRSTAPGVAASPAGALFAAHRGGYAAAPDVFLSPGTVSLAGGSQPHANLPPYAVVSFCIALQGIFPSRN